MFIAIIWGAIVSNLVSTTQNYQKCKTNECIVKVQEIGYKIEVKENGQKDN